MFSNKGCQQEAIMGGGVSESPHRSASILRCVGGMSPVSSRGLSGPRSTPSRDHSSGDTRCGALLLAMYQGRSQERSAS